MKKIIVVGLGYVGSSIAVMLSKKNHVTAVDIDKNKVDLLNNKISPIKDGDITNYLENEDLNLTASPDLPQDMEEIRFIILCTPTNFDEAMNEFDTSSLRQIIKALHKNKFKGGVVIKSTVPINFTKEIQQTYKDLNILFSPEFLREGTALFDNLYPSRIVVGGKEKIAKEFLDLMHESAKADDIDLIHSSTSEAEAIKLFSNAYLAMRVSFFNELDSFSIIEGLNTKNLIHGVSLDERIGNEYNNPSFGYGGYCLPKDTKQLLSNFKKVPQNIFSSIVHSNETRKEFITRFILKKNPKIVGFYKIAMKKGSDNFRESATLDILHRVKDSGCEVLLFDDLVSPDDILVKGISLEENLNLFKEKSDLIVANRNSEQLNDVKDKVFTRDIFNIN